MNGGGVGLQETYADLRLRGKKPSESDGRRGTGLTWTNAVDARDGSSCICCNSRALTGKGTCRYETSSARYCGRAAGLAYLSAWRQIASDRALAGLACESTVVPCQCDRGEEP